MKYSNQDFDAQQAKQSELMVAIKHWRSCANNPILYPNASLRRSCERTAQALEIELKTNVPVCSCCHKPYPHCDSHKD